MKLYVTERAPNPRRVLWTMAEKGVTDIEVVTLNILTGEHKSHPVITASGGHGLPVLELKDGTLIAESIAICRYLESLHPEPNLFGQTPEETALIEMWLRRFELNLANPLMIGARLSHPALTVIEVADPAVAEYYLNRARETLIALDARLKGREFIAGDRLSIADIVVICALDFARIIRFRPDAELTEAARWVASMRARPAAKAG